jgi:hypothetical protein
MPKDFLVFDELELGVIYVSQGHGECMLRWSLCSGS